MFLVWNEISIFSPYYSKFRMIENKKITWKIWIKSPNKIFVMKTTNGNTLWHFLNRTIKHLTLYFETLLFPFMSKSWNVTKSQLLYDLISWSESVWASREANSKKESKVLLFLANCTRQLPRSITAHAGCERKNVQWLSSEEDVAECHLWNPAVKFHCVTKQ